MSLGHRVVPDGPPMSPSVVSACCPLYCSVMCASISVRSLFLACVFLVPPSMCHFFACALCLFLFEITPPPLVGDAPWRRNQDETLSVPFCAFAFRRNFGLHPNGSPFVFLRPFWALRKLLSQSFYSSERSTCWRRFSPWLRHTGQPVFLESWTRGINGGGQPP